MTTGDCLTPLLVLVLMSAFHGEWLALAEEKELTPEELAKGIQKWQEALNYYPAAAENGLKEGQSCDRLNNKIALKSMERIIGKSAEELEREFKEGGVEGIQQNQGITIPNALGSALKGLHPEIGGVCAAAYNLNCGTSVVVGDDIIDLANPNNKTLLKCEPCTCEAPKSKLCNVVAKVVKDRNLPGVSVPKCESGTGDIIITFSGTAASATSEGGSREWSTTAKVMEAKSERSTGQTSGVSYYVGGNSCGLLLIIAELLQLLLMNNISSDQ